jgi:methionyl-tRNA formyltransferase
MRALAPDLGVVVAFGQFIPRSVREIPRHGMINAHASLLPRWRGAAPVEHAILAGDTRTGVTIIRVSREMDAGDICLARWTRIAPEETAGELSGQLAGLAAEALGLAVEQIADGSARFRPQPRRGVTLAPKLGRDFGRLDWSRPAAEVARRIRAATPRPGADVRLRRSAATLRILAAEVAAEPPGEERPGAVRVHEGRLSIRAVDGWVDVRRLQVPGRRPVSAAEFLRGARVPEDEEVESP